MELTTSYQKLGEAYLGSSAGDLYIRIYAKYNSQSVTSNTSSVSYQSRLYFSGGYIISQGQTKVEMRGTSISNTTTNWQNFEGRQDGQFNNGETVVKTITTTINHNASGNASVTASAIFSSSGSWGWSGTASGTATLPPLHQAPLLSNVTFTEKNTQLSGYGVGGDYFVPYLSNKEITISATTSDSATMTLYEVLNKTKTYSSTTNKVTMDLRQNDLYTTYVDFLSRTVAELSIRLTDSLGAKSTTAYPYSYVIPYVKPSLERTSTTIKRKSGNGVNLTDNKATINVVGTIYKNNTDAVGRNNSVTKIAYKVWEENTSEPANYTNFNVSPTVSSNGAVTISNYEISNVNYIKKYNYKIIIQDNYKDKNNAYHNYVITGSIPIGQSTWTEYKDHVDFMGITIGQNKNLNYLGQMISLMLSSAQTVARNTISVVNFNTVVQNTSTALTYSNNKVYIGKGVNAVLVNARYSAWNANSSLRYIYVYKNGNMIAFNSKGYSSTMETTTVVPVQENDYIEVRCYHEQSSSMELTSSDNQTIFQVIIIG